MSYQPPHERETFSSFSDQLLRGWLEGSGDLEATQIQLGIHPNIYRPRWDVPLNEERMKGSWHLDLLDAYRKDPTMSLVLIALMSHGTTLYSVTLPDPMGTLIRWAWESIEKRVTESNPKVFLWKISD